MILDEEVWKRHLQDDRRLAEEVTRLRVDLEALDAEYDRLISKFCTFEARLAAVGDKEP